MANISRRQATQQALNGRLRRNRARARRKYGPCVYYDLRAQLRLVVDRPRFSPLAKLGDCAEQVDRQARTKDLLCRLF